MQKKNLYQGGILNPLAGHGAKFNYEVLDLSAVKNVKYFDGVENQEVPERQILIGALTGGSKWSQEKFLCTITGKEALKTPREGDIISATLKFDVKNNENDIYEQSILASDIYTLEDYSLIREAEAYYQGSLESEKTS